MSRPCSACVHPQRADIDRRLAEGESARGLAPDYGLHYNAVNRHRRHLQPTPVETPAGPDPLHELAQALRARAMAGDAAAAREYRLCLQAIEASANANAPVTDFTATKEWKTARRVLLDALRRFPEARRAVAKALLDIDP